MSETITIERDVIFNLCYSMGIVISMVDPSKLKREEKARLNFVTKLIYDTAELIKQTEIK